MVSISPKEREREREREREKEKERKREKEIASNRCAETREHEEHFPSSVRDGAVEKKREDSTLEPSKSLGKSNLPKREREREPAECPTATAYLDRPVREQVILQILQNVTQTHAIATSKTPSLRSQSARVKLVPVQRRALERKGTRGNTF